ncbi:FtsX-like permease family protein [Patescibacteria group bacterium]|nr:FtsX-like permease family protein [Patescibacteria group bacterium]
MPRKFTTTPPKQEKPVVAKAETPRSPQKPGKIFSGIGNLFHILWTGLTFTLLVVGYSLKMMLHTVFPAGKFWAKPFKLPLRAYDAFYERIVAVFDRAKAQTASRSYFIELSFQNMKAKRTRTLVTVCGMAISIAFIVFLISVGYGLQNLVTTRVARLEELQQAEVMPGLSDELALNDEVLSRLKNMTQVKSAIPLISVVGRISYQDSISDIAVYGTTTEYLKTSAIQPIYGTVFESHEVYATGGTTQTPNTTPETNGTPKYGQELGKVNFSIAEGSWLRVRNGSSTSNNVLGFTRDGGSAQSGTQIYGDYYSGYEGKEILDEDGEQLAVWIKSSFLLWQNVACTTQEVAATEGGENIASSLKVDPDCEDGQYIPLRDPAGTQVEREGYIAKLPQQIIEDGNASSNVLGVSTLIAQAGDGGSLPVVNDASGSALVTQQSKTVVEVAPGSIREAVVNKAVLTLLGIPEDQAVGQSITMTFVAVGDLVEGEVQRIESAQTTYKIVGVTPEEDTPVVYVPFIELRSLGINRFSQIKVIADNPRVLPEVRTNIESMGYGTVSVADTVAQIDSLFSTFRLLLGVIGLVALSVAALGMFNTLTVSLLERTREVGLLKAMGMKSGEVRELFLTESMIMGFYGGILGLLIGFGAGKLLSLILSSVAVAKGVGFIDISVVPLSFVLVVVVLAIIVGILTGYFPARRATKISALNALRYE